MLVTPTPFNTVLWRVLVMTPGGYHEGFYSLLDDEPRIAFDRFDDDRHLYRALADQPAVARIARFTHGFFSMSRRGEQVLINDLRMGQEPTYGFSFVVARGTPGGLRPLPLPQRAGTRPEIGRALELAVAARCRRAARTAARCRHAHRSLRRQPGCASSSSQTSASSSAGPRLRWRKPDSATMSRIALVVTQDVTDDALRAARGQVVDQLAQQQPAEAAPLQVAANDQREFGFDIVRIGHRARHAERLGTAGWRARTAMKAISRA